MASNSNTNLNTTNTSLSSQGHNNPWENAANDSAFSVHEYEEHLLLTTPGDESLPPSSTSASNSNRSVSCGTKLLLLIHVADMICGIGLVLYSYLTF